MKLEYFSYRRNSIKFLDGIGSVALTLLEKKHAEDPSE